MLKNKTILFALLAIFCALNLRAQRRGPKNNIDTLVNSYMAIKSALIANDGTAAHYKANEMFNILRSQPDKGLSKDQRKVLIDYIDRLLDDGRLINESTDADEQRVHFATLSKNMYHLLKGLKANTYPIYEQYCPMKKTYWLSKKKVIENPYYNDYSKMLNCGNVMETLAPAK
ncbi:MAG: DUF3347 domain-containing protein [Bacteroidota bacterium]|nr:DUF3347 domain-containing protein [Bacteroidota bacterium]